MPFYKSPTIHRMLLISYSRPMSRQHILSISFLLFSGICARCQTQFSGWLADFNTVKTNNKISIHTDFQLRSTDQVENIQTVLLRGGLSYHINNRFILTGGYALIHNRREISGISGYVNEHRLWQQLVFNHSARFGGRLTTFQHRLRLEERFIPRLNLIDDQLHKDGIIHANRLRYFFRNITPLTVWSSDRKAPYVAIQNEIFLNVGDNSGVNGKSFDQNRFYLALGYRFNSKFDLEGGYLNQYTKGRDNAFTNNHIVQIATYLRL